MGQYHPTAKCEKSPVHLPGVQTTYVQRWLRPWVTGRVVWDRGGSSCWVLSTWSHSKTSIWSMCGLFRRDTEHHWTHWLEQVGAGAPGFSGTLYREIPFLCSFCIWKCLAHWVELREQHPSTQPYVDPGGMYMDHMISHGIAWYLQD